MVAEVDSGNLPGQGCLQFPGLMLKSVEFGVKLFAEQLGLQKGCVASTLFSAASFHGVTLYKVAPNARLGSGSR